MTAASARARAVAALALALAALATGCRSSSPLAPKKEVDSLLSSIGLSCGKAIQLRTFPGHGKEVKRLDSSARDTARHLIEVMHRDPEATYLGQTMREVVDTQASATSECGLSNTSAALSHALGPTR
jgi:hypothetical protein